MSSRDKRTSLPPCVINYYPSLQVFSVHSSEYALQIGEENKWGFSVLFFSLLERKEKQKGDTEQHFFISGKIRIALKFFKC